MLEIISFFNDLTNKKFKTKIKSISYTDPELIKTDSRYVKVKKFIENKYLIEKNGIKFIIKDNSLPVTYSVLRHFIIKVLNIKLRQNNEITEHLKNIRKVNSNANYLNKKGWYKDEVIRKNTKRGYQGRYYNKSKNKYVWLRSSYEYIYAVWLDKNNIYWDVECKSYRLDNGELYKPDFFIYDSLNNLISIVEIKGWWDNRTHKFFKLKEQLINEKIDLVLLNVDDIKKYTDDFQKIINKWKVLRLK